MLVEGEDDKKFYEHFINDSYIVVNVLNGCYHMPQILDLVNKVKILTDRVIGIKDADFDNIVKKRYPSIDNLFVTDTHDWETMAMTQECENNILVEALDTKGIDLFNQVMNNLTNYSFIKLYNFTEICEKELDGILFKGFTLSKIYDGTNSCDIETCLNAVKNYGNNSRLGHFPLAHDIECFKQHYHHLNPRQLTCGHDIIHGIVCKLNSCLGKSPKIGYHIIEMLFRSSYTLDCFKTTLLYQSISTWAQEHKTIVWVA